MPRSLAVDCAGLLGVSDVAISFNHVTDHFTLSASSNEARALNEWQFTLAEGPTVDPPVRSAGVVDTAASTGNPWPRLSEKAHSIGYRAIAGVPLRIDGNAFATLVLMDRDETMTADTIGEAERLAYEIAPLILTALSRQTQPLQGNDDHNTFHQATGMVMSQVGIGAVAAAAMLRDYARAGDRLVTDVASEVVTLALDFRQVG
jgi:hypothetical protein